MTKKRQVFISIILSLILLVVFIYVPMPVSKSKWSGQNCADCASVVANYGFPFKFHSVTVGGFSGKGGEVFFKELLILDLVIYFLVINLIFYMVNKLKRRQ